MLKILTKLLTTLLLLVGIQVVNSQNISDFFLKLPTSVTPTLSEQQRFEMLEYYKSDKNDSIKNRYGNYVKILSLDTTNQQLTAKTTANNIIEIKLFKVDEKEVLVGVINTVQSPVEVSNIRFYNSNWQVSKIQFFIPNAAKWFKKDLSNDVDTNQNWLKSIAEQKFVKLEFSKTNPQFIVKNQILKFVSLENKKELIALIDNEPLVYELKGNEFLGVGKE